MTAETSTAWQTALTVLQDVAPPFVPEGAHGMTVVSSTRRVTPVPRRTGTPARPSGTCWRARCCSSSRASRRACCVPARRSGSRVATIHYQDGNNRDDVRLRFTVTMMCAPDQPMLTLVDEAELERRRATP